MKGERRITTAGVAAAIVLAAVSGGPPAAAADNGATLRELPSWVDAVRNAPLRPPRPGRGTEQGVPPAGRYAYMRARSSEVVVMEGHERLGTFEIEGAGARSFDEAPPVWSDDGRYIAGVTDSGVVVLDVDAEELHRARCECNAVAFLDDDLIAIVGGGHGRPAARLMRFELPDLSNRRTPTKLPAGMSWYKAVGGGDALIVFGYDVEASAAHLALDVFMVKGDGSVERLGDRLLGNTAQSSASAPATVYGGPRIVYETSADGGSCLRQSRVTLVDATGVRAPVVTDFASMRPRPVATTSNEVHDMWFGRDDSLYASAESWSCDDRTGAATPHKQVSVWRLEGRRWVHVDDRPLLGVRTLPSGVRIELIADVSAQGGHFPTGTLWFVNGNRRTPIAHRVHHIATPPDVDKARTWLALGDSYSSGEGIHGNRESRTGHQPPTDEESAAGKQRDCRRATGVGMKARAWAAGAYLLLKRELSLDEQTFVACTGALAAEAITQIDEARAITARRSWDIVSFSFGGNDVGFAGVVDGCTDINEVRGGSWKEKWPEGCNVGEDEMRARIDALAGTRETAPGYLGTLTLPELYDEVAKVVEPGGDVVVTGYPNLLEAPNRWPLWRLAPPARCEFIAIADVWMLRRLGAYLNEQIAAAVRAADDRHRDDGIRFHFVDISMNPYELGDHPRYRHGLCSDHPWINGITLDFERRGQMPRIARSFHPTQEGYDATANVVAEVLRV